MNGNAQVFTVFVQDSEYGEGSIEFFATWGGLREAIREFRKIEYEIQNGEYPLSLYRLSLVSPNGETLRENRYEAE